MQCHQPSHAQTVKKWSFGAAMAVIVGAVLLVLPRTLRLRQSPKTATKARLAEFPFKSGDLIVTSAKQDDMSSAITKMANNSVYHHIAMVYVEPVTLQVFFWEINGNGTRLIPITQLKHVKQPFHYMVRPLNKPIDTTQLESIIRYQWDMAFNWDIAIPFMNRFSSGAPRVLSGHTWGNNKTRVCAHLVTEAYHLLGVLDFRTSGVDPYAIFPCDFVRSSGDDDAILPLANGYDFLPMVELVNL